KVLVLGREYHLAGCPKLKGQSPKETALADAIRASVGPCGVCEPNKDQAIRDFVVNYAVAISRERSGSPLPPSAAAGPLASQPNGIPPGPSVVVSDNQYHLANCSTLTGQSGKTMSLADAIRAGAGPCPVCSPSDHNSEIKSFVINYTMAISRETEPARRAAAAERARQA